jgi:IclR family transcriptional regulator, KDG regulon repressor
MKTQVEIETIPEAPGKNQAVQSITRAANILKLLSRGGGHSVTGISKELKLSKGTVHRLLDTLQTTDFVIQDPISRHYYLGQFIVSLASNFLVSHQNLIIYAIDEMNHLRDLSGETICLSIHIGNKRCIVEELPSNQNIKFTVGKGFAVPLHVGCTGKVLLAQFSEPELEVLLTHLTSSPENVGGNNDRPTIDKAALREEIKTVREQGYALSFGEVMSDAAGISVPVKGYMCPVSLSIFGPEYRFKRIMQVMPELKKSANRISANMNRHVA